MVYLVYACLKRVYQQKTWYSHRIPCRRWWRTWWGKTMSLHPTVQRMATHTDQYLCCHSHHPTFHTRAVVMTLMCRVEALSSCAQEEKLMSQALQGNGYPKGFIHRYTCRQPDRQTPHDRETCGSVTLLYVSRLSKFICRVLPLYPSRSPSVPSQPCGRS